MQIHMQDIYDNQGQVKEPVADVLSGHKHRLALLPNLTLLNHHIHAQQTVTLQEEAPAGLYFSFLGTHAIHSVENIQSVQIHYQASPLSGHFEMEKGQQQSLLQIRISPSLLASVLGETEDQIIQHFSAMQKTLSDNGSTIGLPMTHKTRQILEPVLSHTSHSISLAGHIYSVIFTLIEQLQMLSHLSRCEDCQSKLFHAQNLIETPEHDSISIKKLAHLTGLNTEALTIGFYLIVGQSIESYCTQSKIKYAAARLRQDPTAKSHIVAESGFSEDQFEAAFIKHFGVSSHHYGQIH
ncbi:helix-turn-helix transcriptional regulator [Marinomonas posidonica]|uniref:Helix-turn-helix, AraC domain protein n=1 Tax=Marinomonas posidonica (strain CECT 7376 / NCIMB 14433 / IVIA-Po-181) TaxID=491952 RepID=F6CVD2_MARPP|nr:helix-turn-helix transcriptional regulator [Marinomonas posidonica]AEF54242.1 Helix-turn-helix, AraC domain protein [Marinomonas posidonica IVIA-Po-181]